MTPSAWRRSWTAGLTPSGIRGSGASRRTNRSPTSSSSDRGPRTEGHAGRRVSRGEALEVEERAADQRRPVAGEGRRALLGHLERVDPAQGGRERGDLVTQDAGQGLRVLGVAGRQRLGVLVVGEDLLGQVGEQVAPQHPVDAEGDVQRHPPRCGRSAGCPWGGTSTAPARAGRRAPCRRRRPRRRRGPPTA